MEFNYSNMSLSMQELYQTQEAEKDGRLVDEVVASAPLLNYLDSRTIPGISIECWRCKAVPFFGPRPIGYGAKNLKGFYEKVPASLFHFDGKLEVDAALLEVEKNQGGLSPASLVARTAKDIMDGGMKLLDLNLLYGSKLGAGFGLGLHQVIAPFMTVSANSEYAKFDATSESVRKSKEYLAACADNTGSSVYFICKKNAALEVLWGNGKGIRRGRLRDVEVDGETVDGIVGTFEGKVQHFSAWVGLFPRNQFAIGRMKNITAETGISDAAIIEAKSLIFDELDMEVTAIVMNKSVRSMLQKNRANVQAVHGLGSATLYAATPTEVDGIPILVDNNIQMDESDEALAKLGRKQLAEAKGRATF